MITPSRIKIKITVDQLGAAIGELIRFHSPVTVDAILKALPLESMARVWGEEVYFPISVKAGAEKSKNNIEPGTLAYWPEGKSFCIFYGKTQPYSRVNVVGKIIKNLNLFQSVKDGNIIKLESSKN